MPDQNRQLPQTSKSPSNKSLTSSPAFASAPHFPRINLPSSPTIFPTLFTVHSTRNLNPPTCPNVSFAHTPSVFTLYRTWPPVATAGTSNPLTKSPRTSIARMRSRRLPTSARLAPSLSSPCQT